MTTSQPPQGQPSATNGPVAPDGLGGVGGAGRLKPTVADKHRRHEPPVQVDGADQGVCRRAHSSPRLAPSIAFLTADTTASNDITTTDSSPLTTVSTPDNSHSLRAERSRRFIRLRTTAVLARAIKPTRSAPTPAGVTAATIPLRRARAPLRQTLSKSRRDASVESRIYAGRLGRQLRSALGPAGLQDRPARARSHSGPETVLSLAPAIVRLESAFRHVITFVLNAPREPSMRGREIAGALRGEGEV
jgi:hypothetical protein